MPRIEPYTLAWYCLKFNISNKTLQRWMRFKALAAKLRATGYRPGQKRLTPIQHNVLAEHLGGLPLIRIDPITKFEE